MAEPFTTATDAVKVIVTHLQQESDFIDRLIEVSLDIQKLLRQPSTSNQQDGETTSSNEIEGRLNSDQLRKYLQSVETQLNAESQPVLAARRGLIGQLQRLQQFYGHPVTLSRLAQLVSEPERTSLLTLRDQLTDKLRQFYSITTGNQTVLVYTLDFYNRLLGQDQKTDYYNATGRTAAVPPATASFLRTNC